MKKYFLLVPIFLTTYLYSQFEGVKITRIKDVELKNPVPKLAIDNKYSKKSYDNLWLNIYFNESLKEVRGYDYSKRIEIEVKKAGEGNFSGNVKVDYKYEWLTIRKTGNSYNLLSTFANLRADKWGEHYSISGNVRDENGKYNYINFTAYKRFSDEFSYYISQGGLTLYFDKNSVNGNFNDEMYSKKAIAYIIALMFSIQIDNIK